MKTTELAFRVMADHMRRQNERSIDEDDQCSYRGERGLKCPIGALIKGEHYNKSMEGHTVMDSGIIHAVEKSGWPVDEVSVAIYAEIQQIHDQCPVYEWRSKVLSIGQSFGIVGDDIK